MDSVQERKRCSLWTETTGQEGEQVDSSAVACGPLC